MEGMLTGFKGKYKDYTYECTITGSYVGAAKNIIVTLLLNCEATSRGDLLDAVEKELHDLGVSSCTIREELKHAR